MIKKPLQPCVAELNMHIHVPDKTIQYFKAPVTKTSRMCFLMIIFVTETLQHLTF